MLEKNASNFNFNNIEMFYRKIKVVTHIHTRVMDFQKCWPISPIPVSMTAYVSLSRIIPTIYILLIIDCVKKWSLFLMVVDNAFLLSRISMRQYI